MEFEKLISKLDVSTRLVFEHSVALASSWGHGTVEIAHWLSSALSHSDKEFMRIAQIGQLNVSSLEQEVSALLEEQRRGIEALPKIGQEVMQWLFEAWVIASGTYFSPQIQTTHLLQALIEAPAFHVKYSRVFPSLYILKVSLLETLHQKALADDTQSLVPTHHSALNSYGLDMTEQARQGLLDPVLCRETEVRQMIDVLCRRQKNNVILTGEAGVGKTAVVEGLAQLISAGRVPDVLKKVRLIALDLGALQAGASVKGEFEKRLKSVLNEIDQSCNPVILFIDEAHGLIGAGNAPGQSDAANLLKPALARGTLKTIAATTWAEYKKHVESDAALTRRFQVIKIDPPTEQAARMICRSLTPKLELHHGVSVLDEAIEKAVEWSVRFLPDRQLPDSCLGVLDTACARVALSQEEEPLEVALAQRDVLDTQLTLSRIHSEHPSGKAPVERIRVLEKKLEHEQKQLTLKQRAWRAQKALVAQVLDLKAIILRLQKEGSEQEIERVSHALDAIQYELAQLQTGEISVHSQVDAQVVAEVISDWTGIPMGSMHGDDCKRLLNLEEQLSDSIKGQESAIAQVARLIRVHRAGLVPTQRPAGVFLLVGPSGVGKTQTALELARIVYGSHRCLTVINMSEFKEPHKVSMLLGSPPGYVGFGEGGVLTEAIRRRPYGVVLLDEIEKAHESCQEIFYQVFDKGLLKDGQGNDIDCTNTLFILTSNVASQAIGQLCHRACAKPDVDDLLQAITPLLHSAFKPALLARMTPVPFYPLSCDTLRDIAKLQIDALKQRIVAHYGIDVRISEPVIESIVSQCQASDTGARDIAALLSHHLMPEIASVLLTQAALNTINNHSTLLIECADPSVSQGGERFSLHLLPKQREVIQPFGDLISESLKEEVVPV